MENGLPDFLQIANQFSAKNELPFRKKMHFFSSIHELQKKNEDREMAQNSKKLRHDQKFNEQMLSCGHAFAFWKLVKKQNLGVTFNSDIARHH